MMIVWLLDFFKCLVYSHHFVECGNYYYCTRCGHLEVRSDLVKIKY